MNELTLALLTDLPWAHWTSLTCDGSDHALPLPTFSLQQHDRLCVRLFFCVKTSNYLNSVFASVARMITWAWELMRVSFIMLCMRCGRAKGELKTATGRNRLKYKKRDDKESIKMLYKTKRFIFQAFLHGTLHESSSFMFTSSICDAFDCEEITFTCWRKRDLRFANLLALPFGWLPWTCGLPLLSLAALVPFETSCSAWSQRIAWDWRQALVGQLLWLALSGCSRYARPLPKRIVKVRDFLTAMEPSQSFRLPFASFSCHRFHSLRFSHRTRWIDDCREFHTKNIDCLCPLHRMAMALFQSKCFFLYHFLLFLLVKVLFWRLFSFVSLFSHEISQPHHGSASEREVGIFKFELRPATKNIFISWFLAQFHFTIH